MSPLPFTFLLAASSMAQERAASLPEYLREHEFSEEDLAAVESGKSVVKLIDAEHDSETELLGVLKIQGAPMHFSAPC
ncbi:MAG: hypothetical protein ACRD21_08965 [Vicinamibacteria bacterium]